MKAHTMSEVIRLCHLLGNPFRIWLLLELGEGPRDTMALVEAAGRAQTTISNRLTELRMVGLVATTPAGRRRVHTLSPSGRRLVAMIERLSAH
jgi:DNA-binding HxlR family transcriptional regulator